MPPGRRPLSDAYDLVCAIEKETPCWMDPIEAYIETESSRPTKLRLRRGREIRSKTVCIP
ncbi:hypothetical protein QJS04_geneDACA013370 [Acorus gramineus]|uniref:Uncharacterized protein n=1 Tax=Acorus gramineus TaxID=55184 RepID=A0AAV9A8J5_ACOGR|nr:hypothetical protein QJS04_geneDACA013370 [Acorus gramineus]